MTDLKELMDVEPVKDVLILIVPPGADPDDPDTRRLLDGLAVSQAYHQYYAPSRLVPAGLIFDDIEWLITSDPADIEKFQPAHDCDTCRAGNDRARDFLTANPGQPLALANIAYREIWL